MQSGIVSKGSNISTQFLESYMFLVFFYSGVHIFCSFTQSTPVRGRGRGRGGRRPLVRPGSNQLQQNTRGRGVTRGRGITRGRGTVRGRGTTRGRGIANTQLGRYGKLINVVVLIKRCG